MDEKEKQPNSLEQSVGESSNEAERKALNSDTKENRYLAFKKVGWFDDLDEGITKPDFKLWMMGVLTVISGEITAVSGKPGAGKSTMLAIIIAVLLGRTEFAGIRCATPCSKVLWIDTEKGAYSCKQKMGVFRRIANIPESKKLVEVGLFFRMMRGNPAEDMLYFIEELAKEQDYDAIVIDGIFDLTDDPQENYQPVITLLQKLVSKGASLFAMLHTNKGKDDDNMRYALGSELQRLCTTRFDVSYDATAKFHIIKHTKSNDTALAPEVSFQFDADGNVIAKSYSRQIDIKRILQYVFTDGQPRDWKKLRTDFSAKSGVSSKEAFDYCQKAQKDHLLVTELDGKMNLNKELFRG